MEKSTNKPLFCKSPLHPARAPHPDSLAHHISHADEFAKGHMLAEQKLRQFSLSFSIFDASSYVVVL